MSAAPVEKEIMRGIRLAVLLLLPAIVLTAGLGLPCGSSDRSLPAPAGVYAPAQELLTVQP